MLAALQAEPSFTVSVLSRNSSKSTFPDDVKVIKVDDDYPVDQVSAALAGQDAVVSAIPGRPYTTHVRIIDAAVQAGVKRYIPSEYGNNTCAAAREMIPLYADKAKSFAHLQERQRQQEQQGQGQQLTWTAIHAGQFFDWGLEAGWLDFDIAARRATIYDSGRKPWSTATIGTASAAVVKTLLNPEATRNKNLYVASFTVSQMDVLAELEKATGSKWEVSHVTGKEALERAAKLGNEDFSEGLKLLILMLLYAEDEDRGADFVKDGVLSNELIGLPGESLADVVARVVKGQGSS